ncbi:MAG: hypothetical protein ACN4GM_16945 [Gammaproteobacteria bacterium]
MMKWIRWKPLPSSMMAMRKIGRGRAIFSGLTLSLAISQPVTAFHYQLNNHQFDAGFRPRIAYVEGDNEDGRAASLLIRLRASSEWSEQFSTVLEMDYVELGWEDEFSNGEHFNDNPVIPDTGGFDLNQALLIYSPTNSIQLSIGREAVNLGNERFVGSNSFWQNEQTLDMTGFKYSFGAASYFSYRYIDNANRINGDDADKYLSPSDANFSQNNGLRPARFLGDHDHNSHLLFAEFKEWDYSLVQAYYYDMDIKDAPAVSNRTLGLRYEFKGRTGNKRSLAHAEFALQDRPEIDKGALIPYYNIGAGLGYRSHEVSLNYEQLGENDGISFTTPLASLHDHNGWADKFLIIPAAGLQDTSLRYIWRKSPWKIDTRYHVFTSAENSASLGRELDVDLSVKFGRRSTLLLRYADFSSSDDAYASERRVFLQYLYNL